MYSSNIVFVNSFVFLYVVLVPYCKEYKYHFITSLLIVCNKNRNYTNFLRQSMHSIASSAYCPHGRGIFLLSFAVKAGRCDLVFSVKETAAHIFHISSSLFWIPWKKLNCTLCHWNEHHLDHHVVDMYCLFWLAKAKKGIVCISPRGNFLRMPSTSPQTSKKGLKLGLFTKSKVVEGFQGFFKGKWCWNDK